MSEQTESRSAKVRKSDAAFRTISEVAADLDVPQHVLRFWESKFTQVRPLKRGGGRRYYRPEDVVLLSRIRSLLYDDGLTIKGVQKLFRDHGVKAVVEKANGLPGQAAQEKGSSAEDGEMAESGKGPDLAVLISDLKAMRSELRHALGTQ